LLLKLCAQSKDGRHKTPLSLFLAEVGVGRRRNISIMERKFIGSYIGSNLFLQ